MKTKLTRPPGKAAALIALSFVVLACSDRGETPTVDFVGLMTRVSEGWSSNDTELALSAFDEQAVYMEPPDIQLYRGHEELTPYFDAVEPDTSMTWHRLWFDQDGGVGAGEYTFHMGGSARAVHGVVVVEVHNGKITFWREYQRPGPVDFEEFLSPDIKPATIIVSCTAPNRMSAPVPVLRLIYAKENAIA